MSKTKRLVFQIAIPVALLIAFAGVEVAQRGQRDATPLGESPLIEFQNVSISQSQVQQFLKGDVRVIKDMKALPESVVKAFTKTGGTRLTIANPGKKFEQRM